MAHEVQPTKLSRDVVLPPQEAYHLFFQTFGSNPDVEIGPLRSIPASKDLEIVIHTPFIFDNRTIPQNFHGVLVRRTHRLIPEEFNVGYDHYAYDPERFEEFVDNHNDEIRKQLQNPEMTREEMLDALSFTGNFSVWRDRVLAWRDVGATPPFRKIAA